MQECLKLIVSVILLLNDLSLMACHWCNNATREILVTVVYVEDGGLKSRGTIRRAIFWRDVFLMRGLLVFERMGMDLGPLILP